jgi:hypothetical protein
MGNSTGGRHQADEHLLKQLPEEDLDFVLQFVLVSGSLKEMARLYSVSYPTIRNTLDSVIARMQQRINTVAPDPMTDLLAELVERGELKVGHAKSIRSVYRSALENLKAQEDSQ